MLPPINGIIHIRWDIQDNPLVLIDKKKEIKNYDNSIQILEYDSDYDYILKFVIIGDANTGKSDILKKFLKNEIENAIIGDEFCSKYIIVRKKISFLS